MPTNSASKMKELAKRVLVYETAAARPGSAAGSSAFRICEKLRLPLARLMGTAGFRSLLARALALAGAEVPWLRGLHIKADGSLEGLDMLASKVSSDELLLGEIVLLSQTLGLLVTFIGPALTINLLQDAWPKGDFTDFES